ncbi:CRISPR-associated endonuclease Cas2 [Patescibacteria group bacterium]|nr:MAG: CRISPR-associated endonuclease Cas2 [Patescibacteria group bacterium]
MNRKRKIYRYKGVPTNIFGLPIFDPNKTTLPSPRKSKQTYLRSFIAVTKKNVPKTLLITYDIPHNKKIERDWFRRQLKRLGFSMIQKSVWVGQSPLPADFIAYVKTIGIEKEFITFTLAQPHTT